MFCVYCSSAQIAEKRQILNWNQTQEVIIISPKWRKILPPSHNTLSEHCILYYCLLLVQSDKQVVEIIWVIIKSHLDKSVTEGAPVEHKMKSIWLNCAAFARLHTSFGRLNSISMRACDQKWIESWSKCNINCGILIWAETTSILISRTETLRIRLLT